MLIYLHALLHKSHSSQYSVAYWPLVVHPESNTANFVIVNSRVAGVTLPTHSCRHARTHAHAHTHTHSLHASLSHVTSNINEATTGTKMVTEWMTIFA